VVPFPVPAQPPARTPLVCIDPGHANRPNLTLEPIGPGSSIMKIKDGGGTAGEAVFNLAVGLKLRTLLQARGLRVAMTRRGPAFTLPEGGNIARARFCNVRRATLFIRIHADGSTDPRRHGASTLYPAWHAGWTSDIYRRSLRAALLVQHFLIASTGATNLGLSRRGDITGFNWSNVPVVLVECGFLTNPTERARLTSTAYQWRIARGLAAGTTRFVLR
jgi:N-acetylmuramoyl-L-alanine amidase